MSEDKEAGDSKWLEVVTNSFWWPVIYDTELLFQIMAIVWRGGGGEGDLTAVVGKTGEKSFVNNLSIEIFP